LDDSSAGALLVSRAAPDGAIGALLARLGYQVYGVRKALLKTSLAPINSVSDCHYNDYLALRPN
jgi:hypothetical protein